MPFARYQPGPGWGHSLFGLVLFLIVVAAAITVVMLLVRSWDASRRHVHVGAQGGATAPPRVPNDALRILDERFARGEIDAEEYTTRRTLLRSSD